MMRSTSSTWLYHLLIIINVNIQHILTEITYIKRVAGTNSDIFGTATDQCNTYWAYDSGSSGRSGSARECKCIDGKSTFIYLNNTCVPNSAILQNSGCPEELLYFKQYPGNPFEVFDLARSSNSQNAKFGGVNSINSNCQVSSQLQLIDDLSGNWLANISNVLNFRIVSNKMRLTWKTNDKANNFQGKMFRLRTQNCEVTSISNTIVRDPCIVFKAKGNLNLLTSSSSVIHLVTTSYSSSMQYSTVSKTPTLLSSAGTSTNIVVVTTPTTPTAFTLVHPSSTITPVKPGISREVSVVPGIMSTAAVPIQPSASTGPVMPTEPIPSKSPDKEKRDKESLPIGAIVGSVLALVAVAIVILLIIMCRRRGTQRQSEKPDKEPVDCSNPDYDNEVINLSKKIPKSSRSQETELEDNYAAIDGDPHFHGNQATNETALSVYQSLVKDQGNDSVYTALNPEPGTTPDYTYNTLERPLFNPPRKGTAEPLYNVLDRSNSNNTEDYLEPGVHIDKRHPRPTSKTTPQNNEPVYNVLEDPDQGGGKGADQKDEPEYNVLESDGSCDYEQIEVKMKHPLSRDNIGYESTLPVNTRPPQSDPAYAVVEGPSSEPAYQSLQVNAPDDKVYEPLDRASRNLEPLYQVLEDKSSI